MMDEFDIICAECGETTTHIVAVDVTEEGDIQIEIACECGNSVLWDISNEIPSALSGSAQNIKKGLELF